MFKESKRRSFLKALSWRIVATVTTTLLVYIFTGEWAIAFSVGMLEAVAKMLIYFFHERLWDRIKYGRKEIKGAVFWITGLPCAGKTTLAQGIEEYFKKEGRKVERLDGDEVRSILSNIGFTPEERDDHIKRMGFLASRLAHNGVIVVASFISPYRQSRDFVRHLCDQFHEIYLSTPLSICEKRDNLGLYARAKRGEMQHFTGYDAPYEPPLSPELSINTSHLSSEEVVSQVLSYIKKVY